MAVGGADALGAEAWVEVDKEDVEAALQMAAGAQQVKFGEMLQAEKM